MHLHVPNLRNTTPESLKAKQELNLESACRYGDYLERIKLGNQPVIYKRTKIIATIGPTCCSVEMMEKLIMAGINIARINMAFGDRQSQLEYLQNIKTAIRNVNEREPFERVVAIAGDLRGPEIRTGLFENKLDQVFLKKGEKVILTTDRLFENVSNASIIYVDYEHFNKFVKKGQKIYIDNGYIQLRVCKIYGTNVECKIVFGGPLANKKVVTLPGVKTDLPNLLEQDKRDIMFMAQNNADMIFVSFVRNAEAMKEARHLIAKLDKSNIELIAKIEDLQGVKSFDQILSVSNGILIGRGDLGIEIPMEKVPIAQKMMVAKCNRAGIPIIVAAMVLESMKDDTRPTKAEVADITTAVLDGADALMLAGETANGKFPVECVETLVSTIKQAEAGIWRKQFIKNIIDDTKKPMEPLVTVAIAACQTAAEVSASAILMTSKTGRIARVVSKFRPSCPVICILKTHKLAAQLSLYRGIICCACREKHDDSLKDQDYRIRHGIKVGLDMGILKVADPVIILSVWKQVLGIYNTMRIVYVPFESQSILY